MAHTTKLRKVGGSIMLAVPPALLDSLGLAADNVVALDVRGGELVVKSARPRYRLDDLLDQCEPDMAFSEEDRAFLDGPPVGRELL